MKNVSMALCALCACVGFYAVPALAGQVALDPMTPGVKYCPAPGADNSEFLHSYWAVDAQTGQMSKITASDHRATPAGYETNNQEEEVLFVAPHINVENRYVPLPGGAPQEPPAFLGQTYAAAPMPAPARPVVERTPAPAPAQSFPGLNEGEVVLYVAPPSPMPGEGFYPPASAPMQPRQPVLAAAPAPVAAPRPQMAMRSAPEERRVDQRPQQSQPPRRSERRIEHKSETAAVSAPRTISARSPEVKNVQASLKKKQPEKRISTSRGQNDKQPWWRHIWRN